MNGGGNRIPPPAGILIDRERPVHFRFEGSEYKGFAGDTIASALAASEIMLLSRSFKYHRPRGSQSMSGDDAGALVQVGDEPNVRADTREIQDGMEIWGQNYFGSLRNDLAGVLERFARFLPVGFYYKAFYRPRGIWNLWEKVIRRTAGLGRLNTALRHAHYDKTHLFCDVAVIGGGPAGMAAAIEAAKSGAEVILIEREPILGGSLNYARLTVDLERSQRMRAELADAIVAEPRVNVMTMTLCAGWYTGNWLPLVRENRLYKTRAKAVVVVTGSLAQPAVFRNNDLPGVLFGSAAQRLIRLYGVRPGHRAVILTSNEDGYGVALDLAESGNDVAAVVDLRTGGGTGPLESAAAARGIRTMLGHTVVEAIAGPGKRSIRGVRVSRLTGDGTSEHTSELISCDLLCVSAGNVPSATLLRQAGAKISYQHPDGKWILQDMPTGLFAAGAVNGVRGWDHSVASGRFAGWAAAAAAGFVAGERPPEPSAAETAAPAVPIIPHPKGRDFVDLDEDIQVKDIAHTLAEGFDEMELIKRYSSLGMGPAQGRQSAFAAMMLVSRLTGRPPSSVGLTTARPPVLPVKLANLAGRIYLPERRTHIHHRHLEAGGEMMVTGPWLRPAYYRRPGGRQEAIGEEIINVHENVGVIDVSTLGKFEMRGPDAAEFLNRIYTMNHARQRIGRARYALMLNEAGAVVDDGVVARLAGNHFYVTASSGNAEGVYRSLTWHNAQWNLDIRISDVTAAFAAVNLAGPKSREVLEKLTTDIDVSKEAFPYLGVRTGTVAGLAARVLRIGFVGELGYEIHVPAASGEALWDAAMDSGEETGIRAFGLDAQRVLRLEKGHVIVSQDTDSLTSPLELELEWALNMRKPFFIGKRSLEIQRRTGLQRRLVGYVIRSPEDAVPEESDLTVRGGKITGSVTSSAWSPMLKRAIGLAYVAADQAEVGSTFSIETAKNLVQAEVARLPFYDPDNARQRM